MAKTIDERFDEKWEAITDSGCWIWTAGISINGYGTFRKANNEHIYAHRFSWERHNNILIPHKLLVCHHCDVRCCVNPAHLFLGTQRDNIHDALRKGRFVTGDRNGSRTKPECRPRGKTHNSYLRPETVPKGERCGLTKLNTLAVLTIRKRLENGETKLSLANEYGVTRNLISKIQHRKIWKHI